jgi:hypothetical protein
VSNNEEGEESDETKPPVLDVKVLANAPPAIRRRALRQWLSDARAVREDLKWFISWRWKGF